MYKKLLFLAVAIFLTTVHLQAQTPAFISYQAVACDSDGNELISQKISIRATIFADGPNGNLIFQEVHSNATLTTDEFGLFTIEVGNGAIQAGSPANSLNQIDWSTGDFWLRVEMDPLGGVNFKLVGANRLLSVPYALYAEKARKASIADVAVTAQNADTAKYVAPTTYIVNAINAINAITSDTAVYSDFAVAAGNALHAEQSDTAQYAFAAGNADFAADAGNALHAEQSDTAQYAYNAGNAQNALEAAHAQNADNALNATNAQNAVEAEHAVNSDTAQYAYEAGHAVLADDATNAISAQSALTALDDNDKDPTNEMQALTYDTAGVLRIVPASQGVQSLMVHVCVPVHLRFM